MSTPEKVAIVNEVRRLILEKIAVLEESVHNLRQALENDDKSTAGDKHETGRAMTHLELEKIASQLQEANQLKILTDRIDFAGTSGRIVSGSLVVTTGLTYLIAVPLGKISLNGHEVFVISAQAPIAKMLLNKTVGDQVNFNGSKSIILSIF